MLHLPRACLMQQGGKCVCMESKHRGRGPQTAKNAVGWSPWRVIDTFCSSSLKWAASLMYYQGNRGSPTFPTERMSALGKIKNNFKLSSLCCYAFITELCGSGYPVLGVLWSGDGVGSMTTCWLSDSKWPRLSHPLPYLNQSPVFHEDTSSYPFLEGI